MNPTTVATLYRDLGELAAATTEPKWDGTDACKAIGVRQWKDALRLALLVHDAAEWLPVPTAGADPLGFIWLTWEAASGARVVCKVNPSLIGKRITWTARRDGMDRDFSADHARDLIESLRATFPRALILVPQSTQAAA